MYHLIIIIAFLIEKNFVIFYIINIIESITRLIIILINIKKLKDTTWKKSNKYKKGNKSKKTNKHKKI